jgi:hypothetical protein
MNGKTLPILLVIFLFALSSVAQTTTKNLLEETNLHFLLEGEPNAQDVGFDNPKSSWKVKYELYVTDFSEMEKLGLNRVIGGYKYLTPMIENKKLNKQIKKKSSKLLNGSFTKKMLLTEANRKVVISVKLPQNVVETYTQAAKNPKINPTFILFVTQKIYVKNVANAKLKRKQFLVDFVPLSLFRDDRQTPSRDVSSMSLTTRIVKTENGELEYKGGLFHGVGW